MKKFWIVLVVVIVLMGAGLGLLWKLMSGLQEPEVSGGVLRWRIDGAYAEEHPDQLLDLVRQGRRPLVRQIVLGLERAAGDARIEGLWLDIVSLPGSWAQVEEFREAVAFFAAEGKPVVAYLEQGGTKEYALALAADSIVLAPEASLMVLGVSAELVFLEETLDKLGLEAEFVHVGRYKSAPEMLTRRDPTPPHRQMIESIVGERWETLVRMLAEGRGVAPEVAESWLDRGVWDSPEALAAGLVDTLLAGPALRESFFEQAMETDLDDYVLESGRRGRPVKKVALVHVTGTIMPGKSSRSAWQEVAGSETVVERLMDAAEDEGIDAVLLRVDSPGGSATASDLIWQAVAEVRRSKPVVVSMGGYAASGGYYVSCGADSVFALPGTLTGSIGVFAGKVDMSGLYAKLGVHREFVARGQNALMFADEHGFTPDQRLLVQRLLESFYARFLGKVAQGRDLPVPAVAEIAEGRVWTGRQAVEVGLVDALGGLPRALAAIKSLLGVPEGQKVALVTYEREPSFLERMILSTLRESAGLDLPPLVMAEALAMEGTLAWAGLMDGRPAALLPVRVQVR